MNPASALLTAALALNALALALHVDNAQFRPYVPDVRVQTAPGPAQVELIQADVAPVDVVGPELARPRAKSIPPVALTPALATVEFPSAVRSPEVQDQAVPRSAGSDEVAPACRSGAPIWDWGRRVVVCNTMLH